MVHLLIALAVPLLVCLQVHVLARPFKTVPYFPHYNQWDTAGTHTEPPHPMQHVDVVSALRLLVQQNSDVGIHSEESRWNPFGISEELSPELSKYFYSYDPSDKEFKDRSSIRDDLQLSVPVYEKGKGGFVPPSVSALDKVYWWEKRFNNFDIPPSEDLLYFDDSDDYETNMPVSMKKRDYTAAQLVNMLKALAKARRQRQIRIAGKGLRFGISR